MTKIETVWVHNPELDAEAQIPVESELLWVGRGWLPGRVAGAAEAAEEELAAVIAEASGVPAAPLLDGVPETETGSPEGETETVPSWDTETEYPTEEGDS